MLDGAGHNSARTSLAVACTSPPSPSRVRRGRVAFAPLFQSDGSWRRAEGGKGERGRILRSKLLLRSHPLWR
eukprot:4758386-Pyramimonas_sp.AAC.1